MPQEIHEYLHPATGIADLSAELAVHGHGGGPKPADALDVEKGLPMCREGSVHRGAVMHVDAAESLTAAAGGCAGGRE